MSFSQSLFLLFPYQLGDVPPTFPWGYYRVPPKLIIMPGTTLRAHTSAKVIGQSQVKKEILDLCLNLMDSSLRSCPTPPQTLMDWMTNRLQWKHNLLGRGKKAVIQRGSLKSLWSGSSEVILREGCLSADNPLTSTTTFCRLVLSDSKVYDHRRGSKGLKVWRESLAQQFYILSSDHRPGA